MYYGGLMTSDLYCEKCVTICNKQIETHDRLKVKDPTVGVVPTGPRTWLEKHPWHAMKQHLKLKYIEVDDDDDDDDWCFTATFVHNLG